MQGTAKGVGVKQRFFVIFAGFVILILGVAYLFFPHQPEWTTTSPEALVELQAAWDASQKLYLQEARQHLEKALSLDPDFVIAKLRLAELEIHDDPDRAGDLFREVKEADLKKLTKREVFLIQRAILLKEGHLKEASLELDVFFREHPDDPQILYVRAMDAWKGGRLDVAEKLFARVLEIRPNWVIAYNQLGYISMIRGEFSKAEEYFTSYRFIAPDQANPYDSLGELYVLIGRWDDAEASFRKALEVKPGFGASMGHMASLEGLRRNWKLAEEWVQRGEDTGFFHPDYALQFRCSLDFWKKMVARDYRGILQAASGACDPRTSPFPQSAIFLHRAACGLQRWDLAEAIESEFRTRLGKKPPSMETRFDFRRPILDHLRGIRLFAQGKPQEAIPALVAADENLSYLNMDLGLFKLNNRLVLSGILHSYGKEKESRRWLEEVRKINPLLAEEWEDGPAQEFDEGLAQE